MTPPAGFRWRPRFSATDEAHHDLDDLPFRPVRIVLNKSGDPAGVIVDCGPWRLRAELAEVLEEEA